MATRAVWRTLPEDPRSALGWLARDGRHWGVGLLRRALFLVPVVALYAFFAGLPLAFLMLLAAFGALVLLVPRPPRGPALAEPSPGPAFVGRVEVRRGGAFLGEDEVAVTFVDGWMVVEGLRTAFSLSGVDVLGTARSDPRQLALTDGTALRFRLVPQILSRSAVPFSAELARWRERPVALGEAVLPPDRPHPGAATRVATEAFVALFGTLAGFTVTVLAGFGWGVLTLMLVPGPSLYEAISGLFRLRRVARET